MLKDIKKKRLAIAVLVFVEAVFFVLIQMGIKGAHNALCFTSVVIAFAFSVILSEPTADSVITVAALFFTVCSDYCLLMIYPEPRVVAMSFFNAVQICYFIRLLRAAKSRREITAHLSVRLFIIAVAVSAAFLILRGNPDTVSVISMIYFANLVTNIIFAFYHSDRYLLFAIGLLSFSLCDVFVGLGALARDYLHVGRDSFLWAITHTGVNFIWLFYVPSQTMIAISASGGNGKKK